MERLLADAQKLSGVEYNIDNLGDVYDAIHVIQEDLGLTGVAAAEAEGTFTGSMGAMKASAENLMANLALGNDISGNIQELMGNVQTFVMGNLAPMIGNILSALPELLSGVGSIIIQSLNMIGNNAGEIVQLGIDIVVGLVESIVEAAPYLVEAAVSLIMALGDALINTDWATIGSNLITSLNDSIELAAGEIFGSDTIIGGLIDSILTSIPELLTQGFEIISAIYFGIMEALPTILEAGVDIVLNLVNGIIENLPTILVTAIELMTSFVAGIGERLPEILQKGVEIIGKLIAGLIQAIPNLIAAIPPILLALAKAFLGYDWVGIGVNILKGIKDGILSAIGSVVEAAKQAAQAIWDAVKGFFQIASPSKLMLYAGEMIDAGLANGINDNKGMVDSAISSLGNSALSSLEISPTIGSFASDRDDRVDTLIDMLNTYLPTIASGENQTVVLEADAGRMFRVMQREARRNEQLVGLSRA